MVNLLESYTNKVIALDLPHIIKWYTCGPTIYADSHLGHARTFITFDILRRYLESIGHIVLYTMNITDIDDKIMTKVKMIHWNNLLEKINIINNKSDGEKDNFIPLEQDELEQILLKHYKEEELWPPKDLFYNFIDNEEKNFWNDMKSLNIKNPFAKIRVTEVHNEMIRFVENLINKNMAYVSKSGSVYFDTKNFKELYPTLDFSLHQESENDINKKNKFISEKKNPRDFALWKCVKKYEIPLDSPWSQGHWGWSLECSVMIQKLFNWNDDLNQNDIDIHSGGIDLKYPHHHNECLQTIALTGNQKWVKYFLHSGHLYINKEKMAKSLGNFITIKNFLQKHNYRILRLLFMNSNWCETLDFNTDIINQTVELDNKIQNLYEHFQHHIRLNKIKNNISNSDIEFNNTIDTFKHNINIYWNDFNTTKIILEIRKIIDEIYKYLMVDYNLVNIIKVKELLDVQFKIIAVEYDIVQNNNDNDKYIQTIVDIRNEIKNITLSIPKDNKDIKNKLFGLSDWIRDIKMKQIGIKIEDQNNSIKWSYSK